MIRPLYFLCFFLLLLADSVDIYAYCDPISCHLKGWNQVHDDSITRKKISLPAMFSNNMVLQRNIKVPFWGTAKPGEKLSVSLKKQKVWTTADFNGKWIIYLDPMKAGGPMEVTISSKEDTIQFSNVFIGDVWIASGQSNMEMTLGPSRFFGGVKNSAQEVAISDDSLLRVFTVAKNSNVDGPQTNAAGQWKLSNPQNSGEFTATGYFFAQELRKELGVAIGIISTSWGASPAQAWTSKKTLTTDPELLPIVTNWEKTANGSDTASNKPIFPQKRPASLYNGMISPLIPYGIKGVIWYQGEGNTDNPKQYQRLFPAMISNWRNDWGQGNFPFLFVQLANFKKVQEKPSEDGWAGLREAQRLTALDLTNTEMAVAIDIGDEKDIHAKNKKDVGRRLALNALSQVYKHKIQYSGPLYKSMKIDGNKIHLLFEHARGLKSKDGKALKGFAIAGKDKKFVWGLAKIKGKTIILSSPQVDSPIAVRYSWADNPIGNLYNSSDLPASPFRTDN
jgi:sialate O-acetylesterase